MDPDGVGGGGTQTLVAVGGTAGEPVQYLTLVSGGTVADISDGHSTAVIPKSSQRDMGEGASSTTPKPSGGLSVMIGNRKVNLKIVSGGQNVALINKPLGLTPRGESSGVSSLTLSGGVPVRLAPVEEMQEEYVSPQVIMAQRILAGLHPTNPNAAPPDEEGEVVCMFCGCCFESSDELASHEPLCAAGETDSGNLTCHCGKNFSNSDALAAHQHTHETGEAGDFVCRFCGKSFASGLSLATHESVHSVTKPFRCSYCNKSFLKRMDLLMHERLHGGENPYMCSYCGKNYSSRIKLLRHESQHTGQKPFLCNYCGKGFTHKQSLMMHERQHTGIGEKPFQCPICTKCFARQTNYNIHMKLHASGRRFFCSFCGKWYRTEHEMLDHQQNCLAQLHGQPVPTDKPLRYQCGYCEKMFHHRRDKNIHERVHTGERPYSCGYCHKGFTQSQALTIHIRTHTGERPYACGICGKDFRDSSALRKHEFVKHTNMRSQLGPTGGAAFLSPVYTGGGDPMEGLVVDQAESD